jgi:dTDP-4-amino-4,6-dideoxygalactose transaminase
VVTNDGALAARVRLLANHGDAGKYDHVIANGRNSRLDALQAAILRIKLRHLDAWNAGRRRAAARYIEQLRDLPLLLPHERSGTEAVYHQFAIRVPTRQLRAALAERHRYGGALPQGSNSSRVSPAARLGRRCRSPNSARGSVSPPCVTPERRGD